MRRRRRERRDSLELTNGVDHDLPVVGAMLVKGAVTSSSVLHAAASRDNAAAGGTKRNMSVFVVFFPEVVYAVPAPFKSLVRLQCGGGQNGDQHGHSNGCDEH